jgi:hypothetical protein
MAGSRGGFLRSNTGYLKVYTATRAIEENAIVTERHLPYSVYRPDGTRVLGVANHVGPTDQDAMTVPLPAGDYVIYAPAAGYGQVKVPVQIVGSRLTEVHLQWEGMEFIGDIPPDELVRLPDGRVIGRKPEPPPQPPPAKP